jgi:hypothetical protein
MKEACIPAQIQNKQLLLIEFRTVILPPLITLPLINILLSTTEKLEMYAPEDEAYSA